MKMEATAVPNVMIPTRFGDDRVWNRGWFVETCNAAPMRAANEAHPLFSDGLSLFVGGVA